MSCGFSQWTIEILLRVDIAILAVVLIRAIAKT